MCFEIFGLLIAVGVFARTPDAAASIVFIAIHYSWDPKGAPASVGLRKQLS